MSDEARSRNGRAAAEQALVRIVHHYGQQPEFVLLGGLVPELLCQQSPFQHAGTTDIDVQVNLEITCGAVNTRRLEQALRNAEFSPESERIWRWMSEIEGKRQVVKFELLADLEDQPAQVDVVFSECERLGAVNLRGTRFAAQDRHSMQLHARQGGVTHHASIYVAGLAGFIMAKIAAAHGRHLPKDWYDIAFVLQHNDRGGHREAAGLVKQLFSAELAGDMTSALVDLEANFADPSFQGPQAYAEQMVIDHPDQDASVLAADAVVAVAQFCAAVGR